MPLLMLCGHPSAGLTTRAKEIEAAFNAMRVEAPNSTLKNVVVITDQDAHITKDMYNDRNSEKMARQGIMGLARRHLNNQTLVIVDNMCYIKGFRYQLFCEAKALQTTSCVVYVGTPPERCRQFNSSSPIPWNSELFEALIFRFEEPDAMAKWDSPLFILSPEDKLPIRDLWECLIERKPMRQNQATAVKPTATADYLTVLNDTTGKIIKEAMDLFKAAPGGQVLLAGQRVQLPYTLTTAQLARIRRSFIQVNRAAPLEPSRIAPFFVQFLTQNWELR